MSVIITTNETVTCRRCGSQAVVKYGAYKGVPRYFCKTCNRKFKRDEKQFKMKTDTEQVATAMHDYYDGGSSVRAIGRHILQETGTNPSTATIYEWIQKYTKYAIESIKAYHPKVGNKWIADETVLKIGGQNVWLYDIIDSETRYLLASRLCVSRTTKDAQMLMDRAIKVAGKHPKTVCTDKQNSYLDVSYGDDAEHHQGSPFSKEDNTNLIERWHGTVKARTKVMRGLKNLESAIEFTKGFEAYYNYLRPHESLDNKTPAESAGIQYPYKNWDDLIRNFKPKTKFVVTHVERGTPSIFKIQASTTLSSQRRRLNNPTFRISRKMPRLTNEVDLGGGIVYNRWTHRRHLRLD